jgi:hypothetical protein
MKVESNRVFGRIKARELTPEEAELVGGGVEDVFHSRYCPNNMSGGGVGETEGCLGCTYTGP